MFRKKPIKHEDITAEDIQKHIRRHHMMNKQVESHVLFKSITFIMLFFIWLFYTVTVESIQIRYFLILVGLPMLVLLFHIYIVHSNESSEPLI